jgi:uncharacterized protein
MSDPAVPQKPLAFHVMAKPIGPMCNLDCKYCFYLEKERLYSDTKNFRMSEEVLENYVRQYIAAQEVPEINFAWQGGEPTLMGLDFFRHAVELQKKHCPPGKRISNAFQTNGILVNDEWCRFFHDNGFLIGLSIDGPRELHDHYRLDRGGQPTFDRVLKALELMLRHRVEFNTLTVVNRQNSRRPLDVYSFFKKHGVVFMQFIPLVERIAGKGVLAAPPVAQASSLHEAGKMPALHEERESPVTPWSVQPQAWGEFLCAIFDEWVRNDVGQIYLQLFEVQLARWMGLPSSLCVFAETCGNGLILEHNGDLYACDHYVYPEFMLGNLGQSGMREMVLSPAQTKFGADKRDALPRQCLSCEVRFACAGECPKHRFLKTADGDDGLNYLCAGYKRFFTHIDPYMKQMVELLKAKRPPALIMSQLARREKARSHGSR